MKQKFFTLAALCCVLLLCAPAAAAADYSALGEPLTESADYAEIQQTEETILDQMNEVYQTEYGKNAGAPFSALNYDHSVKIYIDTDVLALHTDDETAIQEALDKGDHIWVIETTVDGITAEVTLGRGEPLDEAAASVLTEEEKEEVRRNEGKWCVQTVSVQQDSDSFYPEKVNQALSKSGEISSAAERVVIVGGIPAFRYPIAIAFDGEKATHWISLGEDFITTALEDEDISAAADGSMANVLQEGASTGVYDFNTLADYAQATYKASDEDSVGGAGVTDGAWLTPIVVVVIGLLACVSVLLLRKKR